MKFIIPLLWLCISSSAQAESVIIAQMRTMDIQQWQHKEFAGKTDYQMITLDGERVLQAKSNGGASGLFNELRVDLRKTPIINWRWRAEKSLSGLDEHSKQGDDYVARIYIVVSGGMLFWNTKALNYVWSSNQALDSQWNNAYTAQAKMLAVETGVKNLGQWRSYQRNVAKDLQALFGEEIEYIDAIAIMTDTDNGKGEALTYYGDIYFSTE